MAKACGTCKANRICDHYRYGSETCGNYIPEDDKDYEEVRHGKWDCSGRYKFVDGSLAVRCSECGCSITSSEYERYHWNYCPNCGAKMDGGKV